MKVLHILGSLNRGGTENLLLDLFRNIGGVFCLLCIHRKRGALYEDFFRTHIPMLQLPVQKHSFLFYFIKLRKLLLKENVDIVHCHQAIDALMAYFATIGTKIKIVFTLHGYGIKNGLIGSSIRKLLIKNVDVVIFVSDYTKKYYFNKFNLPDHSNFHVLWNGIDFDKFHLENSNDLRNEFEIQKSTFVFGTVGSFSSVRDQMTICHFLAKLILQRDDFLFLFIGAKVFSEPELFDNCVSYCQKNGLEKHVKFIGVRRDVPQILPQLDAFVYSTVHDTFGIAVIEAIYAGVPVFLNDWGVMMEITDNGKHATIYRSKDENDLLQKFIPFLEKPKQYEEKAKIAKRFVKNTYSIQSHILNLKDLYQSIVRTGKC